MSGADDYEDLIGPVGEEPPYFPALLRLFREGEPDDHRHMLRSLFVHVSSTDLMQTVFPDYDPEQVQDVARAYKRLRAQHIARDIFNEEFRPGSEQERPEPVSLTDLLDEPEEEVGYRVDDLWPAEGRVVLAAQNKSGKTTLIGNLIRSLVDDEPFLNTYRVKKAERVVLIDNELGRRMVRGWLRDQGIVNTDAVTVINLKGRLSTFNLLDPEVRQQWAQLIGPADVLLFDCLRPALDSLGLSEDKDAGRFLVAFDELCAASSIPEAAVVHHMGHANERSRGDSRIEDWPDAKWKLVKMDPGDGSDEQSWPRFFSAFGRDVDQAEVELLFNPFDRHLSIRDGGRNRAQAKASKMDDAILAYVQEHPGCSQGKVELSVTGDDKAIRKAISRMEDDGLLVIVPGPNRTKQHYLPDDLPNVENS